MTRQQECLFVIIIFIIKNKIKQIINYAVLFGITYIIAESNNKIAKSYKKYSGNPPSPKIKNDIISIMDDKIKNNIGNVNLIKAFLIFRMIPSL